MSKKLYAAFLPALAVAAFVAMPAAAQAQFPHWYSNNVKIKVGTKEVPNDVQVTTKGTLTLNALERGIECKVKDKGSIWNPAGGAAGEDEITEFLNSECKIAKGVAICAAGETLEVVAGNLPWYSKLVEIAGVIRDEIFAEVEGVKKGIEVKIECNKAGTKKVEDTFTGTLTPKIGTSVAEFGAGSGELEDAAHNKATVTGNDTLEGPAGDESITAKTP
jgi:hypothetical protein